MAGNFVAITAASRAAARSLTSPGLGTIWSGHRSRWPGGKRRFGRPQL